MLKILSSAQTKDLDRFTIEHDPVAPIDLMERACHAFTAWFVRNFRSNKKIGIICGPGNNGGDGLGIARLLAGFSYSVKVWIVKGGLKESESFKKNLERIEAKISLFEISKEPGQDLFIGCDVLVDALFGSGLSRPLEGIFAQIVACMNQAAAIRVAVDIPSGLFADSHSVGDIIQAHHTVSFQLPKLAFLFAENHRWVGRWHLVDIGLSKEFIESVYSRDYFLTEDSIKKIIRPRAQFSHKGNYGHALLIAGSHGKMGACVLAAKAALRAGVGLLTLCVPTCGYSVVQTVVPEAMAVVDISEHYFSSPPENLDFSSIGVGPGLGVNAETVRAFAKVLKQFKKPTVVDADGLNMLATNRELFQLLPQGSILTPHPKEFERMAGHWTNDFERLELLRRFSAQLNCIVILKGAYTSIAFPNGDVHFNSTGNPGMATGGSGDVLTGVLTSLLAQGYSPKEAALLGTYIHGMAGDLAALELGMNLIASDIIQRLPDAFEKLIRA
jgi:ADP-dependent NAD(P)H-hydrate dehydratase / NAD(P)H-hydrate epimerase